MCTAGNLWLQIIFFLAFSFLLETQAVQKVNLIQRAIIVPMLLFALILVGNTTGACCLTQLSADILVGHTDTFKLWYDAKAVC